ncbi:ABC transporter permease [Liquorilactobacillus mali]|uniref:ABC transporter permease n=1 Tax=Liquorilactobacillus mali TaxID=1618 RepID=UPI000704E54B|nr:ABC transporter permease [Liquorilactobacillus mali]MDN7145007.1 ABC transporter permease [Liquorilactobacillus mali]
MLTKRLFLLLYTAVFAIASVFLFVKIQQKSLIIQLDNHNLSAAAYHVTLSKKETIWDVTQTIKKSKNIKNVQIHFQDKKNKHLTYFYGTGSFGVPPMINGNFFGTGTFDSEVEVAVVGKNYEKKLYEPKDQEYLKIDNKYVPVLGVMGDKYSSQLDKQIFIALSIEKSKRLIANNYRIIVDGKKALDKNMLKSVLGAKKVEHLAQRHFLINQDSWILDHFQELLMLFALFGLLVFGVIVWIVSNKRRYRNLLDQGKEPLQLLFEEWEFFALLSGLGTVFGVMAGMFITELTNYIPLLIYNTSSFILINIIYILLLRRRVISMNRGQ